MIDVHYFEGLSTTNLIELKNVIDKILLTRKPEKVYKRPDHESMTGV